MKRLCLFALLSFTLVANTGCFTGLLAKPHQHLTMRPDYSTEWLNGDRVSHASSFSPDANEIETHDEWSIRRTDLGALTLSGPKQVLLARPVPIEADRDRCLLEISTIEIDGEPVDENFLFLAVASRSGDTLTIAPVHGALLAEYMRLDGHSGVFENGFLYTTFNADMDELCETLDRHESKLVYQGTSWKLRAASPQETSP